MPELYSLEKAREEAEKIIGIVGENASAADLDLASKTITEERETIRKKLSEELKALVDQSILVINLENHPDETSDILVDTLSRHASNVRDYLKAESSVKIVREESGPRKTMFYLKID